MSGRLQDLPVILHNDKRGLLTVEEGRLDVLQLSREGRREYHPKYRKQRADA
jgi:sphingosine kinase